MAGILFLLMFPPGSSAHFGELQSLMTVTSLFTDTAGTIPFLRSLAEEMKAGPPLCPLSLVGPDLLSAHGGPGPGREGGRYGRAQSLVNRESWGFLALPAGVPV